MSDLSQHDGWLTSDSAAAIVIREPLLPVEGDDGVIFPATYAAAENKSVFPGGYNIDPPTGEKNVCLVDSVGSQANRMEPIFAKPEYQRTCAANRHNSRREVGEPPRGRPSRRRCHRPLHPASREGAGSFLRSAQGQRPEARENRADVPCLRRMGFARHAGQGPAPHRVDNPCVRCRPIDALGPV